MPIKFHLCDNGVMRAEWLTTVSASDGETTEVFVLNDAFLTGLCQHRLYERTLVNIVLRLQLCKTLTNVEKIKDEVVKEKYKTNASGQYVPLSTVWVTIEKERPLMMRQVSQHEWQIETAYASNNPVFSNNIWFIYFWVSLKPIKISEINILCQFADMFTKQKNCDVQFCFDNEERIGGHLAILSARSPVFEAMFQPHTQEFKLRQVFIQDISPNIFKEMLHYIYSSRTEEPLTELNARSLYITADKYDLDDLRHECIDYLISTIRVENVIDLLIWSHVRSVDEVKNDALAFAATHGKELCILDEWERLVENYPNLSVTATRLMMEKMALV